MMVNSIFLNQNDNNIVLTSKTVDWLVNNTKTLEFNPVDFSGYQRQIDPKHCAKIVEYLKKSFYMPATIICSIHQDYSEDSILNIVDGQHRVKAFKIIKEENPTRYDEIKNEKIPVVVLVKPDPDIEISTFITINKTAKKVDTSLAFVLKNKLNAERTSSDINIPRREYISVESAWKINFNENSIWFDRIMFENSPSSNTSKTISLNAWVKSMRVLLGCFERHKLIVYKWDTKEDIDDLVDKTLRLLSVIWDSVKQKWSGLFEPKEDLKILQGAIGFNSIHKLVIHALDYQHMNGGSPVKNSVIDETEYQNIVTNVIKNNLSTTSDWKSGGSYSKFSSESGYTVLGNELVKLSDW